MMKLLVRLFALLMLTAAPAQAGERVGVAALGISLEAPDGWQRISAEEAAAHLPEVRLGPNFRHEVARAGRPIISLRKADPARYAGPVPILNVLFSQLIADRTAMELMQRTARVVRQRIGNVEILDEPHPVQIAGLPGAHLRIAYVQEQRGVRTAGISEYWVVVRGDYYFAFSSGYGPNEPPATRAAIQAAIASVRIEPEN